MSVLGIEEIFLAVKDMKKSVRFYNEFLGIPLDKQDEEHRVWYVAVTRTAKNLYFLKSKIERNGYII